MALLMHALCASLIKRKIEIFTTIMMVIGTKIALRNMHVNCSERAMLLMNVVRGRRLAGGQLNSNIFLLF